SAKRPWRGTVVPFAPGGMASFPVTGLGATARTRLGSSCECFVVLCDPDHHLPGQIIVHLFSQDAGFFGSVSPVLGIVEMWSIGITLTAREAAALREQSDR